MKLEIFFWYLLVNSYSGVLFSFTTPVSRYLLINANNTLVLGHTFLLVEIHMGSTKFYSVLCNLAGPISKIVGSTLLQSTGELLFKRECVASTYIQINKRKYRKIDGRNNSHFHL